MQKQAKSVIDGIIFSNTFIALAAAAQVGYTYQMLGLKPDLRIIALMFFATMAFYNFSILLSKPLNPAQSPYRRTRWIFAHQRLIVSLSFIAISGTIILGLLLPFRAQLLLLFLALLSAGYNLPLFKISKQKISLRNIPGIKLFLIALVWSLSTLALPLLISKQTEMLLISPSGILFLIQRLLFIAAITIPFDIRDRYQDRIYGLKTLPILLGEKKAYVVCQLLLIASLLIGASIFPSQSAAFATLLISTLLAGWLIFRSQSKKNEYYYFLYLDGVLILPFLIFPIFAI